MLSWLQNRLSVATKSIAVAGVFGSVSTGFGSPNDCDLYVVSQNKPDTAQWQQLKDRLGEIREEFHSQFYLPLNVVLLTHGEWEEKKDFFLCNTPAVLIENRPTQRSTGQRGRPVAYPGRSFGAAC